MIILCVTQCSHGGVAAFYETGKVAANLLLLLLTLFTNIQVVVVVFVDVLPYSQVLMNAGAIPGLDITPEAALAKLAHVLSLPIRFFLNFSVSWKLMIFFAFNQY